MATLLAAAGTAVAASGWGFDDATVSVKSKEGDGVSERYGYVTVNSRKGRGKEVARMTVANAYLG